jgi:GntR family transcriptional regulator, vanillate catabolism transcriptional regulator
LVNIREMVLRGEFKPGERIFEVPLAERLGVSRTPIRLALERLAQEGLLETLESGIGFTVREFTLRDIWDAIEARGVLEGAAARLAAERLTDPHSMDRIRQINDEMDRLTEPYICSSSTAASSDVIVPFAELNLEFHSALVELARSPMLQWTIERLQMIPFATPRAVILPQTTELLTIAKEQHRAILEAVANREGTRAEMIVREHARMARRNLELALQHKGIGEMPGSQLIRGEHPDWPLTTQ